MATQVDVIKALQDEFERFINGHSNTLMAAERAFNRIRPMIAIDGEPMSASLKSTADPRVGLRFTGTLHVEPDSEDFSSPRISMLPSRSLADQVD